MKDLKDLQIDFVRNDKNNLFESFLKASPDINLSKENLRKELCDFLKTKSNHEMLKRINVSKYAEGIKNDLKGGVIDLHFLSLLKQTCIVTINPFSMEINKYPLSYSDDEIQIRNCSETSGLKWREISRTESSKGMELKNAKLAKALQTKTELEFMQEEWNAFAVKGLTINHFVEKDGKYFQPVSDKCVYLLCYPYGHSFRFYPILNIPNTKKDQIDKNASSKIVRFIPFISNEFSSKTNHSLATVKLAAAPSAAPSAAAPSPVASLAPSAAPSAAAPSSATPSPVASLASSAAPSPKPSHTPSASSPTPSPTSSASSPTPSALSPSPTVPTVPPSPTVPPAPTVPTVPSSPTVPPAPTVPPSPTVPPAPTVPPSPTVPPAPTAPTASDLNEGDYIKFDHQFLIRDVNGKGVGKSIQANTILRIVSKTNTTVTLCCITSKETEKRTLQHKQIDDEKFIMSTEDEYNNKWKNLKKPSLAPSSPAPAPSLDKFKDRRLKSKNYKTTCYLNAPLISLLAFENTFVKNQLFLAQQCSTFSHNFKNCSKGREILNLLIEVSQDLTTPLNEIEYDKWPYGNLFNAIYPDCSLLGLDKNETLGGFGEAAQSIQLFLDLIYCTNKDKLHIYDFVLPYKTPENLYEDIANELLTKKPDVFIANIHNDGNTQFPPVVFPQLSNLGYCVLAIIVYRNVHYTSHLYDPSSDEWIYFDANGGTQYTHVNFSDFNHTFTLYIERINSRLSAPATRAETKITQNPRKLLKSHLQNILKGFTESEFDTRKVALVLENINDLSKQKVLKYCDKFQIQIPEKKIKPEFLEFRDAHIKKFSEIGKSEEAEVFFDELSKGRQNIEKVSQSIQHDFNEMTQSWSNQEKQNYTKMFGTLYVEGVRA